eukprot:TRINITY_DN11751_c0_g1_i1.p1 TRINITY_DN11751_c0_g1~~TRINITY_DN11751_c0_g1_i1.p1  ORF type:complete len:1341 (+),score=235.78 TRINITY_DN11751_c0_g1_i1:599-4024(+)
MEAFFRLGQPDEALKVFAGIKDSHADGTVAWNGLLAVLVKYDRVHDAEMLLSDLMKRGSTLAQATVDIANSHPQLAAMVSHAVIDQSGSDALVKEIVSAASRGNVTKVAEVAARFQAPGDKPEAVAVLIRNSAKANNLDKAIEIFETYRTSPDKHSAPWWAMLNAYESANNIPAYITLIQQMMERNIALRSHLLEVVLQHCDNDTAMDILSHSRERNKLQESGPGLIQAFFRLDQAQDGRRLFSLLRAKKQATIYVWNAMLRSLINSGRSSDAVALFKELTTTPGTPQLIEDTQTIILSDPEVAKQCARHFDSLTFAPTCPTLRKDIITATKAADVPMLQRLTERMASSADRTSTIVTEFIQAFARLGQLGGARAVFDRFASTNRDYAPWWQMLNAYYRAENFSAFLDLHQQMIGRKVRTNIFLMRKVLQHCDLPTAQSVMLLAQRLNNLQSVAPALLDAFGRLDPPVANQLFAELREQKLDDINVWNGMLKILVQNSNAQRALDLYSELKELGTPAPSEATVTILLRAASAMQSTELLTQLRADAASMQLLNQGSNALATNLIEEQSVIAARKAFDESVASNSITVPMWSPIINMYLDCGNPSEAYKVFAAHFKDDFIPDRRLLLKIAGPVAAQHDAKLLDHVYVLVRPRFTDPATVSVFIECFGRCGEVGRAHTLFQRLQREGTASVHSMLQMMNVFAQAGQQDEAFQMLIEILHSSLHEDISRPWIIKMLRVAAGSASTVMSIHSLATRLSDTGGHLSCALISAYDRSQLLDAAERAYARCSEITLPVATAMMQAYCNHRQPASALQLYRQLGSLSLSPNALTLTWALRAADALSDAAALNELEIRVMALTGADRVPLVQMLMTSYGRFGHVSDARRLFDELVRTKQATPASFTLMAGIHRQHEEQGDAVLLMRQLHGGESPEVIRIRGATMRRDLTTIDRMCRQAEAEGVFNAPNADVELMNVYIEAYGRCRIPQKAHLLFVHGVQQGVATPASWEARAIASVHGAKDDARVLLKEARLAGIPITSRLVTRLIQGSHRDLEFVLHLEQLADKLNFSDLNLSCSLIHAYACAGATDRARAVFDKLKASGRASRSAWFLMLRGYQRMDEVHAEQFAKLMQHAGYDPRENNSKVADLRRE